MRYPWYKRRCSANDCPGDRSDKKRDVSGLPPIKDVWAHWMGDNVIVASDRELKTAREVVSFAFTQTGFMILPSKIGLPENVEAFLNSGKPPVYIGFGSNPIVGTEKYNQIFEMVRLTCRQLIF